MTSCIMPQGERFSPHQSRLQNEGANSRIEEAAALHQSNNDPIIGKVIGDRWMIVERLGEGGMSVVYKAKHTLIDKVAAVKALRSHLVSNETVFRRLVQEAAAGGKFDHPNLVTITDIVVTPDSQPFLIMDFIDGMSLCELLRERRKLSAPEAVELFLQCCDALNYVHANGVVHRDLKPSNVMLVKGVDGKLIVKVVDFGLAKLLSQSEDGQHLTRTGEFAGSPPYMSPEQCLEGNLDERSDIYSLGCLMFETLTGSPPFLGHTAVSTLMQHVHDTPRNLGLTANATSLERKLQTIVLRTLEKDPAQRYQSMLDLKADLELAVFGSDSGWRKSGRAVMAAEKRRSAARRSFHAKLLAAMLVLSCGIAAPALVWWQNQMVYLDSVVRKEKDPAGVIDKAAESPPEDYSDRVHLVVRTIIGYQHEPVNWENLGLAIKRLGDYQFRFGYYEQAIQEYNRAARIFYEKIGHNVVHLNGTLANMAYCYYANGQYEDAVKAGALAASNLESFENRRAEPIFWAYVAIGNSLTRMGEHTKAAQCYETIQAIVKDREGSGSALYARASQCLGNLYLMSDLPRKAETKYRQALTAWSDSPSKSDLRVARCWFGLAQTLVKLKREGEAEQAYSTALELAKRTSERDGFLTAQIEASYGKLLLRTNPIKSVWLNLEAAQLVQNER